MIYRLVNAFFKSVFYFLNEVRQLHVKEIEQMHSGGGSEDEVDSDATDTKPDDPFVKTSIKSEWTPEKTIKITLDIIIGSDGLAVFMHPFSYQPPRAPTPPPHPIPDPVDDTPTIDEFHIDVDFGDRAPAASAAVENDVNVVEE